MRLHSRICLPLTINKVVLWPLRYCSMKNGSQNSIANKTTHIIIIASTLWCKKRSRCVGEKLSKCSWMCFFHDHPKTPSVHAPSLPEPTPESKSPDPPPSREIGYLDSPLFLGPQVLNAGGGGTHTPGVVYPSPGDTTARFSGGFAMTVFDRVEIA